MFCKKCGLELEPNNKFCKNCGQLVEQAQVNNASNVPNSQINNNYSNSMNTLGEMNYLNNQSNINYNNMNGYGQMSSNISNNNPSTNNNILGNMAPQNVYMPNNNSTSNNIFQNSNNNTPKGKGGIGLIIVIFILAVIAAFCVIALPKIFNKDGGSSTSNNTYKVNYNGYSFKIPNDLDYEISEEDGLSIYSDAKGWLIYLIVEDGNYEQIKINIEQVKSNLVSQGYTVTKNETKVYKNKEFLNIYVSYSGQEFVYSLVKFSNNKFFVLGIFDLNYSFDDELFNTLASIISTAEYNSSSNSMKADIPNINQLQLLN